MEFKEEKGKRDEREEGEGGGGENGKRKAMTCGGIGWYNQGGFGFTLEEMKTRCIVRNSY